ncbi:J domain-containing protein [Clostridium sp. AF19-22AC]|uniref:DnaJ-like protein n=2 Tax=Bacillota TaxID=1239 RepID=A0A2Y9BDT5_9FIRM|nr:MULTISPECIES: J domain-containing protein [Clostridia]PWJ31905.1 DnaJ-like protein [Faecalicatena orotica]RHR32431.1 J domain-containing protein [Clostridium sp. AF19-22AC]SSA53733.1 DnaJ domain-containing protein [Faecalicatena orotica]
MGTRTYYDILGVSREATLDEITSAKNALAKVYHPDANIHSNIDTTAYMQEILEAYRILSNPDKRKKYNLKLSGGRERVFRTYTVGPEPGEEKSTSFVTYWNAACRLNEIVSKSSSLMEQNSKREGLPLKIFKRLGRPDKMDEDVTGQLNALSLKAIQYITTLKMADIPMAYWHPDAMNWILVRWGQKQNMDYRTLFAKYDAHIEHTMSSAEKMKLRSQSRQFHNSLKKLLNYAIQ